MKNKPNTFFSMAAVTALVLSAQVSANVTIPQNQTHVVIPIGCDHNAISFPYTLSDPSFDESAISVSSDSQWAIPTVNSERDRIDVQLDTDELIVSYTATLSVNDGVSTSEMFVQATVLPLDVYRLIDDPVRAITYGIQQNGNDNGSIIAFDPLEESIVGCITTGQNPTDFVINEDSSELLVINSVGESIDVIDLDSFTIKETIALPQYSTWGDAGETSANIELGPDGIIYYVDGAWGPVLHVLKRSTGEVLQSLDFSGTLSNNNTGFMDIAVTSDKRTLVGMPQYGWSAGSHSSIIGQFSINDDGTVEFVKTTTVSDFARLPFEAPVLMRDDDEIAVMKTIAASTDDIDNLDRSFPSAVWSMAPNGSVVATANTLYDYKTGNELLTIPGARVSDSWDLYTHAQAFTSDYTRFVYFNRDSRSLEVINLVNTIGLELLGQALTPANGAVVNSPDSLNWNPLSGVSQYDVYLCAEESELEEADLTSDCYLGRVSGTSYAISESLANGTEYFWRIDPVTAQGPETGVIFSFNVSSIALDVNTVIGQTVAGHANYPASIQLSSTDGSVSWQASAQDTWVSFEQTSGTTPSTLQIFLNASELPQGVHTSSITLSSSEGEMNIPVELQVDPLKITHIRNDRASSTSFAISEDTGSVVSRAYLLEIDSEQEKILRVTRVGSSVTDFTIHYADNLIYATNWKSGNLLAIDRDSFALVKTHAFQPAGAVGYSQGDVYRVAAGVSERLVLEEWDQWIDISVYNTNTETEVAETFVREGGGAFEPSGRYYYHGENNSSGAAIIKFDTAGDVFTSLAEIRPEEIASYYGARTVIVSEDGSRIFWAGVVFDKDLNVEWGNGDIIYAASGDGAYAFGESAIYNVNLKKQILGMPATSRASGYNTTSEKLMLQVGDALRFYSLSTPVVLPAPVLSADESVDTSITLRWTDESLEMAFNIQQRMLGMADWVDVHTTGPNETSWQASGLEAGTSYEFRVRASAADTSSAWSNVVIKREDDVIDVIGRNLSPAEGAITTVQNALSWTSIPWIEEYDVYLCQSAEDAASADTASSCYLGRASGTSITLQQALQVGQNYYWRIDPIMDSEPESGHVYQFFVSDIGVNVSTINAKTFSGHPDFNLDIQLSSNTPGLNWRAVAADSWVTFTRDVGTTPSTLSLQLDASSLAPGLHLSTVTLLVNGREVNIPVEFTVAPLNVTHIRSDRNSSTVYAISEDNTGQDAEAFLLEIDTASESVRRVLPVGSSVTDVAIHYRDNLVYVTNWVDGQLLAVDRDTFEVVQTHEFEPASSRRDGDVYRVAAGASQRLVIEEEDQWIDISLYNTRAETIVSQAYMREGGGAFDPSGRYYYHGDNNISNAAITKYDTAGDAFSSLVSVRPAEISSYYGSRTVVVSEDGTRVFWAGVVMNADLETEWGIGDIIYSVSADGRYAISESLIYDVDLQQPVLGMPRSTQVSGYNTTTEKLIVQVEGRLGFYSLNDTGTLVAPKLNVTYQGNSYVELNWSDESLETGFTIQRRKVGEQEWEDLNTLNANTTSWGFYQQSDVRFEYRISAFGAQGSSVWSNIVRSKGLSRTFDYDGDGLSDLVVRRPTNATWYVSNSSGTDKVTNRSDGITRKAFGDRRSDIPVSADYDGDGVTDIAFRRPETGVWYIYNSSGVDLLTFHDDGISRVKFGDREEDIPVPADYDGDGRADLAFRRPSNATWYIRHSWGHDRITFNADGVTRLRFGDKAEDIPVPADYDGDGMADIAVRRPSTGIWYIRNSSGRDFISFNANGVTRIEFGDRQDDIPVPADYDGDGRTDLAFRRPGNATWYVRNSSGQDLVSAKTDGVTRLKFGDRSSDLPIPADYDGDGLIDFAVRRPSTGVWYIRNSSGLDVISSYPDGISRVKFGDKSGDIPAMLPIGQIQAMLQQ